MSLLFVHVAVPLTLALSPRKGYQLDAPRYFRLVHGFNARNLRFEEISAREGERVSALIAIATMANWRFVTFRKY